MILSKNLKKLFEINLIENLLGLFLIFNNTDSTQHTVKVSPFGILPHRSAQISHVFYMRNVSGAGAEAKVKIPKGETFTVYIF